MNDGGPARPAVIASDARIAVRARGDINDAVAAAMGTAGLIVTQDELAPEFFDLRTGLLGELMQKFVNYRQRLAIIVPDPTAHGERFAELAYEHRTHPAVRFPASLDEARAWLASGS